MQQSLKFMQLRLYSTVSNGFKYTTCNAMVLINTALSVFSSCMSKTVFISTNLDVANNKCLCKKVTDDYLCIYLHYTYINLSKLN